MQLSDTIHIEILGEVNTYLGMGIQVLCSLTLGALVGFDREKKMKAAGLKTNILICIGACLYTSVSILHLKTYSNVVDPNRVAAQIVSGIGFLGAGAIIQGRGYVTGLTTAATIWVVAAIGYTVGVGQPVTATLFSITVLIVLKLINPLYQLLEREKDQKMFQLEVLSRGSILRIVRNIVYSEMGELEEVYEYVEDYDETRKKTFLTVILKTHPRILERIVSEIEGLLKVEEASYHAHIEDKKSSSRPRAI